MKKTIILLSVVLACACSVICTYAEQILSPVTPKVHINSLSVTGKKTDAFVIETLSIEETSADVKAIYKSIETATKNEEGIFTEEESRIIQAMLPDGIMPSDMLIVECVPLHIIGYEEKMGDVEVSFVFPWAYSIDDILLSVFTSPGKGTYSWSMLKTAAEEHAVRVTFPCEALRNMEGTEAILLILRNI